MPRRDVRAAFTSDRVAEAFAEGRAAGVLHLGAAESRTHLHPTLGWWRDLGGAFVAAACAALDPLSPEEPAKPEPDRAWLQQHALSVPPMVGAELSTGCPKTRARAEWTSPAPPPGSCLRAAAPHR